MARNPCPLIVDDENRVLFTLQLLLEAAAMRSPFELPESRFGRARPSEDCCEVHDEMGNFFGFFVLVPVNRGAHLGRTRFSLQNLALIVGAVNPGTSIGYDQTSRWLHLSRNGARVIWGGMCR